MLAKDMRTGAMRGFIVKHKAVFEKAIIAFAKIVPEPTKENTKYPNTHILMDIRDKFFELENNPGRKALFEAAWKVLIAEYEHDPYYRFRLDWVLEEIQKSGWRERPAWHPVRSEWNEPLPEGLIQFNIQLPSEVIDKLRERAYQK